MTEPRDDQVGVQELVDVLFEDQRLLPIFHPGHAEAGQVTGKSFFWARTVKVPYLSVEEAQRLLAALKARLGG